MVRTNVDQKPSEVAHDVRLRKCTVEEPHVLRDHILCSLGVNGGADNGHPTLGTIYNHALLGMQAELSALLDLPWIEDDRDDPAFARYRALFEGGIVQLTIARIEARLGLLAECAHTIAELGEEAS
jgi:hypothetical protein